MKLKDYQERALTQVERFLEELAVWRKRAFDGGEWLFDFAEKAWEKSGAGRMYLKRRDGLGRPLPVFCLKIPTGGGKTLLGVKTIDLVQGIYRQRQTGLVVWIVPTLQIYRQTLLRLKDRDDPYRQHLDIVSAGRTMILEKTDVFAPQDLNEYLAILLLMLPSASRANTETLRMFRDSGAFQPFFPPDEDKDGHAQLLKRVPNLETFERSDPFWGSQVKTSLGNTIRLQEPIIILDEGHKAYSQQAQGTLRNLNPCMIVELSATPPRESNNLVEISGLELHREEMIKLDLHVINRSSVNWRDTIRAAMQRRDDLEEKSRNYQANTNVHIRPICLVQVERTGREQRDGKLIHSEDVREYLMGQGVRKGEIAVKSAELDELRDFDDIGGLLARDCPIRYIITKHALQEGWDCSFAYVLAILTNPHSKTALTQLVGRILRQPYARKTHVPELDESYVYCFQRTALMEEIRQGFSREGLQGMEGRIVQDTQDLEGGATRWIGPRRAFKTAAANMVLPAFLIRDGKEWRLVSYEGDILSRVPWKEADVSPLFELKLSLEEKTDIELRAGLEERLTGLISPAPDRLSTNQEPRIEYAYAAAHLLDTVPNPWVGYEFAERVFGRLLTKWRGKENVVSNNLVFILEELRKRLEAERDRLAELEFNRLLHDDRMRFMVVLHDLDVTRPPKKVEIQAGTRATRLDGSQFLLNLYDPVPLGSLNSLEHKVASFLDEQSLLYFWYRNIPHRGYYVQGWQKSRIYADFIFTTRAAPDKKRDYRKVFVLETKGLHLKNENTQYKKSVFALCNDHAKRKTWNQLVPTMQDKEITYEVVFQDEWEKRLNELIAD